MSHDPHKPTLREPTDPPNTSTTMSDFGDDGGQEYDDFDNEPVDDFDEDVPEEFDDNGSDAGGDTGPNGLLNGEVDNFITSGDPAAAAAAAAGGSKRLEDKKIPDDERNTTPYMTKYERARLLGTRALQIRFVLGLGGNMVGGRSADGSVA